MIEDYERVGVVTQSAATTVWKGFDPALKRSVALKQVKRPDAADVVRREAAALAQLRHPNIVTVYDVFDGGDDMMWLVEQWVNGAPLSAVLARCGRLRAIDALALVHGALTGLSYAHDQNIVHGDVTPANILIDDTGTPMLVDFGLAAAPSQTSIGGTPGYMAPEAASGAPVDKCSDVYSSCVVLAELLKGTRLFPQDTALAVTRQQTTAAPALDDIERPVATVLRTGLDIDPQVRPADAKTLLARLESAIEETHGRGWLAAAGLGTLGSTAATISAGITLTAATAPTAAAAAPAVAAPSVPAAPTTTKVLSRGRLLTAGAVGAAIIAVIVAFFLLRTEPPQQTAATTPPSTVTGGPTPGATPAAANAAAPMFRGTYANNKGPNRATVTSDCPGCDVTVTSPGGSGQLRWNGVSWQGPIETSVCAYVLTATPTVVVNGIAQELSYRSAPSPCTRETTGTLIRTGD